MTVYLPVRHPHCARGSFTVLVLCSDDLAIRSCPLLCLQRQVGNLTSVFFYCWSLLR